MVELHAMFAVEPFVAADGDVRVFGEPIFVNARGYARLENPLGFFLMVDAFHALPLALEFFGLFGEPVFGLLVFGVDALVKFAREPANRLRSA